jgi:transposase
MDQRELERVRVIGAVSEKQLTQREAALQLGLSVRQVKRLIRRYREQGDSGLISRHRGKASGNRHPAAVRQEALAWVRGRYADFGPTLAHEHLTGEHGLAFSVETLRRWMIEDGLWQARSWRKAPVHPQRERRACLGELVQADGSPHDWFEGRGPVCTLLVFIDDATSELLALRFAPVEDTRGYLALFLEYVCRHGLPQCLYTDKYSVFRVNQKDREDCETQFGRVLRTLGVRLVYANTPQAKGRVERANQTLQDRLVKQMRLRGINDIEAANAYLPEYLAAHNRRFAKPARDGRDAHRPVAHNRTELEVIFSLQHERQVSPNREFQYQGRVYQVQGKRGRHALAGRRVVVCEGLDGQVRVFRREAGFDWAHELEVKVLGESRSQVRTADTKDLNRVVDQELARPRSVPPPDHPWRKMDQMAAALAEVRKARPDSSASVNP